MEIVVRIGGVKVLIASGRVIYIVVMYFLMYVIFDYLGNDDYVLHICMLAISSKVLAVQMRYLVLVLVSVTSCRQQSC